ncbi:MAG TPA: hypothetical protein VJN71_06175 [Nitrososphaerales archaeon]|nr:hypothetical protein [Nitrososphaerales archaeon]
MNKGEKIVSFVMAGASLGAFLIAIVGLPSNPPPLNLFLAAIASLIIAGALLVLLLKTRSSNSMEVEERRLEKVFPRIYAFLESIESIKGEEDYIKLEAQLEELIEIEKSRSIRWKEMQDIGAIRGIALAKLFQKRRFK